METVLVVDEDPLVRRAFRALLSRAGYRILQAGDLSVGVALARSEAVDLVITDLEFGGQPKPEAPSRFQQVRDVPVIAVCADPGLSERAARCGIKVLKKPPDVSQIRAAIADCLAHREGD